jgi:hypothetical protein
MSGSPPLFWILVSAVLLALVTRFYGRKALSSVLALAGALLAKDAAGHFWGRTAEWSVVGLFAVLCVGIYAIKRRNRDHHVVQKHHPGSGGGRMGKRINPEDAAMAIPVHFRHNRSGPSEFSRSTSWSLLRLLASVSHRLSARGTRPR